MFNQHQLSTYTYKSTWQKIMWESGNSRINQSINQSKPSLPLLGHRPPRRFHQAFRSWANLSNCIQLYPVSLTSASRSRRNVFLGIVLFSSTGFHVKACRVMLSTELRKVWPIHLQRFCRISCSTGIWHVCCHNCSLLTVSGHQTPRILLGQLLTTVCKFILYVVVTVVIRVSLLGK